MLNGDMTLEELLNEPIIRKLMQRDGVSDGDILRLADQVRRRSRRHAPPLRGIAAAARNQPFQAGL